MLCLSLDASSLSACAALHESGVLLAECYAQNGRTHSTSLMPMVDFCLHLAGRTMEQVGLVAVAAGPGSFTGVRIAVATAMGLAEGRRAAAVNTLEALARQAQGFQGLICPLLDARAGQVYAAAYRDGREVLAGAALPLEGYLQSLRSLRAPCLFVGDGVRVHAQALEASGLGRLGGPNLLGLHGGAVCELALDREDSWGPAESLRPIYLRAPSAERARLEKQAHA